MARGKTFVGISCAMSAVGVSAADTDTPRLARLKNWANNRSTLSVTTIKIPDADGRIANSYTAPVRKKNITSRLVSFRFGYNRQQPRIGVAPHELPLLKGEIPICKDYLKGECKTWGEVQISTPVCCRI